MRKNSLQHKIADYVAANPGQRLTEIAAAFGDGRNTMAARLRSLAQYGHVEKVGAADEGFRYFPAKPSNEITPMMLITNSWTADGLGKALAA